MECCTAAISECSNGFKSIFRVANVFNDLNIYKLGQPIKVGCLSFARVLYWKYKIDFLKALSDHDFTLGADEYCFRKIDSHSVCEQTDQLLAFLFVCLLLFPNCSDLEVSVSN